jgi:hypothetical protein
MSVFTFNREVSMKQTAQDQKRIHRVRWRISDLYEKKWRLEKEILRATQKLSMLQEEASRR